MVTVGRLIAGKRPGLIIDAFGQSALNDWELIIIGDGKLQDQLEELVEIHQLGDQVVFTGRIPREEVYEQLCASSVFISASVGEGLPIAVLEALACQCIPILSNIPPHREISQGLDCVNFFEVDDLAELKKQLNHVVALSPDQQREMGIKCRDHAISSFSLTSMLKEYQIIYNAI